jgi:transporter family protein
MSRWPPYVWAIMAALCWGVAPFFEKMGLAGKGDPLVGVFIRSLGILVGIGIFAVFTVRLVPRLSEFPARYWIFLMLGGLLASIVGQLCFYRALKTGQISQMVPIGASYPVLSFLLGLLFLGEPLTSVKVAGIILVMSGVFLLR